MRQFVSITPILAVFVALALFLAPDIQRRSLAACRILEMVGTQTAWILITLLIILLVLANFIHPGYIKVFLHDPSGLKLLYACMGLSMIGIFVIHRIANGVEV
jgi:Flp pilus assembly protein TadB